MELASVLSELLKLLLGTSGLGDLEHTEGRCLTLGPALARGDDVASLHILEKGAGAQTHSRGTSQRDCTYGWTRDDAHGCQWSSASSSEPPYPLKESPWDGVVTSKRCFLSM